MEHCLTVAVVNLPTHSYLPNTSTLKPEQLQVLDPKAMSSSTHLSHFLRRYLPDSSTLKP